MALINGPAGSSPEQAQSTSPVLRPEVSNGLITQIPGSGDVSNLGPSSPEKKPRSKMIVALGAGTAAILASVSAYAFTRGGHDSKHSGAVVATTAPSNPTTTLETTSTTVAKPEVKLPSSNDPQELAQELYDNLAAATNTNDLSYLRYVYPEDPYGNSDGAVQERDSIKQITSMRSQYPELELVEHVRVLQEQGFNDTSASHRFINAQIDSQLIKQHYGGGQVNSTTYHKEVRLTLSPYQRADTTNIMHPVWLIDSIDDLTPTTQTTP